MFKQERYSIQLVGLEAIEKGITVAGEFVGLDVELVKNCFHAALAKKISGIGRSILPSDVLVLLEEALLNPECCCPESVDDLREVAKLVAGPEGAKRIDHIVGMSGAISSFVEYADGCSSVGLLERCAIELMGQFMRYLNTPSLFRCLRASELLKRIEDEENRSMLDEIKKEKPYQPQILIKEQFEKELPR